MSYDRDLPSSTGNKCNFKGIEHFLRRIAFNLGNTPSKTEVKIISCIPIDVTDLQQKIVRLERQLEEATAANKHDVCHVGLYCPNYTVQHNVCEIFNRCTDVELSDEEEKASLQSHCVITSADKKTCPHNADTGQPMNIQPEQENLEFEMKEDSSSKMNGSVTKVTRKDIRKNETLSQITETDLEQNINQLNENKKIEKTSLKMAEKIEELYRSHRTRNSSANQLLSEDSVRVKLKELRRRSQAKRKKFSKKKNNRKTYLTYFTQKNIKYKCSLDRTPENIISRTYLQNMISKQYTPKAIVQSSSSQFSSPVCRDNKKCYHGFCSYDSDVCSCCHGHFHDVDNELSQFKRTNIHKSSYNTETDLSRYYNSKFYDIIPVKDIPMKLKKEELRMKNRFTENACGETKHFQVKNNRTKKHIGTTEPNGLILKRQLSRVDCINGLNKTTLTNNTKDINNINMLLINKLQNNKNTIINDKLNNRNNFDINNVTKNKAHAYTSMTKSFSHQNFNVSEPKADLASRQNAECVTILKNNCLCQTTTSNSIQTTSTMDSKTETMLNQIKAILQTVINEIKINSHVKIDEQKNNKKDAIVQNSSSQNNLLNSSRVINNMICSSYNNDPFITCSNELNTRPICYSGVPSSTMRYMQNFPLLIQCPGQPAMCNHLCCAQATRHLTTLATNTTNTGEKKTSKRSKETENLIKEIYDSIALNIETPLKKTHGNNYTEHEVHTNNIDKMDSSTMQESKYNENSNNKYKDKILHKGTANSNNKTRFPTACSSTNTDITAKSALRNCKVNNYLDFNNTKDFHIEPDTKINPQYNKFMSTDVTTIENGDSSNSSNSCTDSDDDTIILQPIYQHYLQHECVCPHKEKKKNLFNRILNTVRLFKSKNKPRINIGLNTMDSECSNSEIYETIYNDQMNHTPREVTNRLVYCKKLNSNVYSPKQRPFHYGDTSVRYPKNSLHLDEEYRRYWEGKLTNQRRRDHQTLATKPGDPYWQGSEASPAITKYMSPKPGAYRTRRRQSRHPQSPR